jgi:hypothetical protein
VPRGAAINRRTLAFGMLRHMRWHVDRVGFGREVLRSKAFIVGQRDLLRSVGVRCNLDKMRRT